MAARKSGEGKEAPASRGGIGRLRVCVAVVLVVKMGLVAVWLVGDDTALARGDDAITGQAKPVDTHPALQPVAVSAEPLRHPGNHREARSLLQALSVRQAELEERERALEAREDRVGLYEKDLSEKIAYLETLQKQISKESNDIDQADSEAASSLAKVYAAMKPSEAAPLLDRLDDKTVLRILAHMRAKQIGELLPLLDRDKAIVLTQALAGS